MYSCIQFYHTDYVCCSSSKPEHSVCKCMYMHMFTGSPVTGTCTVLLQVREVCCYQVECAVEFPVETCLWLELGQCSAIVVLK